MWGRIGQSLTVPSAGQNRRVPVFGALDAVAGRTTVMLAAAKRSAEFPGFLRRLLARYAGRHLFLFLDNCSIHTAKVVQRFLADHRDRITAIWNAPYAPELNLIERYWGHLKAKAIHNYYFGTVEALERAIREAVTALNRAKEMRLTLHLDALHSFRGAA